MSGRDFWMVHGVARMGAPEPAGAPRHVRCVFGNMIALLSSGHLPDAAELQAAGTEVDAGLAREAAAAQAHTALLTAYALVSDVVPLVYGASVSGPSEALERLGAASAQYARVLDRVSGAVEYTLRLSQVPDGAGGVRSLEDRVEPGRSFLGIRRDRRPVRDVMELARSVCVGAVAAEARAAAREVRDLSARADRALDLALLTPHGSVQALVATAERAGTRAASCGLTLALSGPWPAYGFTHGGGEAGLTLP